MFRERRGQTAQRVSAHRQRVRERIAAGGEQPETLLDREQPIPARGVAQRLRSAGSATSPSPRW